MPTLSFSYWSGQKIGISQSARSARSLNLGGTETFDLTGIEGGVRPRQDAELVIHRTGGETEKIPPTLRVETPVEADYYNHGGILPFVLRQLVEQARDSASA